MYCGQTIRMPLGMEVGLGPGHTVLDWDPVSPTERGTAARPPLFGPLCSGTVAHLSNCWALVHWSHNRGWTHSILAAIRSKTAWYDVDFTSASNASCDLVFCTEAGAENPAGPVMTTVFYPAGIPGTGLAIAVDRVMYIVIRVPRYCRRCYT